MSVFFWVGARERRKKGKSFFPFLKGIGLSEVCFSFRTKIFVFFCAKRG